MMNDLNTIICSIVKITLEPVVKLWKNIKMHGIQYYKIQINRICKVALKSNYTITVVQQELDRSHLALINLQRREPDKRKYHDL